MGTCIKIVKSNFLTTLEISLRLATIQGMFIQGSGGTVLCPDSLRNSLSFSLEKPPLFRVQNKSKIYKLEEINFITNNFILMFHPNSILFWVFRWIYRIIFEDLLKPDYCYDYYSSRMALDINIILLFFSKLIKCFISLSIAVICRIS